MHKEASYYLNMPRDFVECVLCPHNCHIPPSRIGLCGVRRNIDGKLFLTSYGRISRMEPGMAVNLPLSPLFKDHRFLYVGSSGCNMKCPFCLSFRESQMGSPARVIMPDIIVEKAKTDNVKGIAFTYNEPTIALEFILDIARSCREEGLAVAVATNGFLSQEPFLHLINQVNIVVISMVSWETEYYRVECGASLEVVMKNITAAIDKIHIEICYPVIEGVNDSDDLLTEMVSWLSRLSPEVPLHLIKFRPAFRYADYPETSTVRLYQLQTLAHHYLKNVYISEI